VPHREKTHPSHRHLTGSTTKRESRSADPNKEGHPGGGSGNGIAAIAPEPSSRREKRRRDRVKRYCRVHGVVPATGCVACRRVDADRRSRVRSGYGYGRAHWKRLRIERLEAARFVCELRLPGCALRATHVHLDPRLEGRHDVAVFEDCRACCAACSGAVDAPRAARKDGGVVGGGPR
jgi:hypothetical protein